MTIRTRLVVSVSVLLAVSTAVLSYGVVAVSRTYASRDAERRVEVIVNSVERAAQDALLQKDKVLLISYAKFLESQYPSLANVSVSWRSAGVERQMNIGKEPPADREIRRQLQVTHPADPSTSAALEIDIDRAILYETLGHDQRRLLKILAGVGCGTTLLGMLFAFWFAGTVTRPIEALSRLAGEIGKGRLGARLEWSSNDELGALVHAFNGMSARLEELDEVKKNFVSSVTHELRSPLGAIESFLHLIRDRVSKVPGGSGEAQTEEYMTRIQANVARLSGFINDLLDVAKIEKGKMECVLRPMALRDVAGEVREFFDPKARAQGVVLSDRLPADLPPVLGDPERVRQVLVNLVSNALKFTPAGGAVTISAEQFREGSDRWVEVSVADTGRGIPEADRQRLFKAFSQGRNVSEGVIGTKGTGLGLFIVKSIVEQHGGRLDVRSAPGKGTEFRFSVKLA